MGSRRIRELQVTRLATAVPKGGYVSVGLGPSGELVFLVLEGEADYRRIHASGGSSAKLEARHRNKYLVSLIGENESTTLVLEPTTRNHHQAQPLPDSHWLLISGRSAGPADPNAFVYDASGKLIRTFYAGDGIEDCQVTGDGRIWLSYFDEGVFNSQPLGSQGLVCMDQEGELLYELPLERHGSMADCYALNVAGDDDVWCYYYTDFPLVRIRGGKDVFVLKEAVLRGSVAFAIGRRSVLFAGDYKNRYLLFEVDLESRSVSRFRPVDEQGQELPKFRVIARGQKMLLIAEQTIWEVTGWSTERDRQSEV